MKSFITISVAIVLMLVVVFYDMASAATVVPWERTVTGGAGTTSPLFQTDEIRANYYRATSTTATSTFAAGINIGGSARLDAVLNCSGSLQTNALGYIICGAGGSGITSLNGLSGATQTFSVSNTSNDWNVLAISSSGTTHTFTTSASTSPAFGFLTATSTEHASEFRGLLLASGGLNASSTATSTFAGGISVASIGGLSSASGVTITGGQLKCTTCVPNTSLANSTISGKELGTSLDALTNDSTLSGSSYNGSSAISDWGINLGNANTWTALQTLGNIYVTASSTIAGSYFANNNLNLAGLITSSSTATSTFLGGMESNALNIVGAASSTFSGGIVVAGGVRTTNLKNCNGNFVVETNSNGDLTCGSDAGAAGSVTSVNDNGVGTLTVSPTTGDVEIGINLGNANTWTALQTFGNIYSTGSSTLGSVYLNGGNVNAAGGITASSTSVFAGLISTASSTFLNTLNIQGKLSASSTATSTFGGGINVAAGCFSIAGVCVGGGGGHDAVTLAGQDYLTLSTQQITANEIQPDDLAGVDFGPFTCDGSTCTQDALAELTATDTTLTFSGTYNGLTARTIGLNLGNANTWTALQTHSSLYATASTTVGKAYMANGNINIPGGITASSTSSLAGLLSTASSTFLDELHIMGKISASSTATSTFDNGINLIKGCFAINGVCVGGGDVSSVSDSGAGTLTISPTTGAVLAAINLGNANSWTALQTHSSLFATASTTIGGVYAANKNLNISGQLTASSTITGADGLTITGGAVDFPVGSIAIADLAASTISGISLGGTLANLTATDATLTFSGTYTGATARTIGLNLGNANTWTALQTLGNLYVTASSTISGSFFNNGSINIPNFLTASTSIIVDPSGALVIPQGSNPTVNAPGEIAFDTTDNQLLVATSTGTLPGVIPLHQKIWGFTMASTSARFKSGEFLPVPTQKDGYVITRIECYVDGGTSKVINISHAGGSPDLDSITCATTLTADDGNIDSSTFTAGELARVEMGAGVGTVNFLSVSVFGTWLRE